MTKIKSVIKPTKSQFRKQLKLKIILNPNNPKNDYEGGTANDFQDANSPSNVLQLLDLKVSGKKFNILTFIVEGYFSNVMEAAIKFAVKFDPIDYDIQDIEPTE